MSIDGQLITLPRREYNLIECLFLNHYRVLTHGEIEQKIYDDCVEPMSNVVDSAISKLRKLIDQNNTWSYIITHRGHGYQLREF
ncbi:helix-turn-helix domain-containing protein [Microbulbifer epialgicus]|uniref:Helix-turn-helix domain-containing protein n=1 Tax=Microbulbifer epialgicus TaxID=393907 RepID=A0ABV4P6R0_9GAMM